MIEYVEKIIPESYQNELVSVAKRIPWIFTESVAYEGINVIRSEEDEKITDASAMTHLCFDEGKVISPYYDDFKPILWFLEQKFDIQITELHRIRLRLTHRYPGHTLDKFNPPHVDIPTTDKFLTFVYYIDDSDGDTVIFDKKYTNMEELNTLTSSKDLNIIYRSTPKRGDGILFDGSHFHSGNSPVEYRSRYIVNLDFKVAE